MTTTNTADNFAALANRLSTRLEELRKELSMRQCVLTDTPFVVRVGGLFLGVDRATMAAKVVLDVREAVQFSRERATEIAASTTNGNGERGEVVTIIAALEGQIAGMQQSLALIA